MSLLTVLRRWGLVEETEAHAEIRRLEAEKAELKAALAEADDGDVQILKQHVAPARARRAEQDKELSAACTPYLDIWNERGHQSSAVHPMQKTITDQIKEVDEMLKDRYGTYASRSKCVSASNVIFSSMADRVHAGVPFPAELAAFKNLPAPSDDAQELLLETLEGVSKRGAPTLQALQSHFAALRSSFSTVADGGDPTAAGIKQELSNIQDKLARSEVADCIDAVEGIADEVSLYPGHAPALLRRWHQSASDYSVANQALHFLGADLHSQKYSLVEPYLQMQLKEVEMGTAPPRAQSAASS